MLPKVMSFDIFHSTCGVSPVSPGFLQYTCQPGSGVKCIAALVVWLFVRDECRLVSSTRMCDPCSTAAPCAIREPNKNSTMWYKAKMAISELMRMEVISNSSW